MGKDIYAEITDRFITEMEQGVMPWRKPWVSGNNRAYNNSTNRSYNLLNQCLLPMGGAWDTFNGWKNGGAKINKGSKASYVVQKFYWVVVKETGERVTDTALKNTILAIVKYRPSDKVEYNGVEYKTGFSLKFTAVFHISQTDGAVKAKREMVTGLVSESDKEEQAEQIFRVYIDRESIRFTEQEQGNEAYYAPLADEIVVPKRNMFNEIGEFYSTVFHEITHSTGNAKRLNRPILNKFGKEDYAKEELVAEMGSAFILNSIGIESQGTFKNSTAYLASWLKALHDDKKFIYTACANAEKASEYVLA